MESRKYQRKGEQCAAYRKSDGQRCERPVLFGQKVCLNHGGRLATTREANQRRLETMVGPALKRLLELVASRQDSVALAAVREVLDRTGYIVATNVNVDNQVTISVSYQDVELAKQALANDPAVIDVSYALPESNGNGHEKAPD